MTLPGSRDFDFFAFGNRENCADNGYSTAGLLVEAGHSVVGFRMLVRDATDGALQGGCFVLLFGHSEGILLESLRAVNAPLAFCRRRATIPTKLIRTLPLSNKRSVANSLAKPASGASAFAHSSGKNQETFT
jgi:hypothetical protein